MNQITFEGESYSIVPAKTKQIIYSVSEFEYDDMFVEMGTQNISIKHVINYETGTSISVGEKIDPEQPAYVFFYYSATKYNKAIEWK